MRRGGLPRIAEVVSLELASGDNIADLSYLELLADETYDCKPPSLTIALSRYDLICRPVRMSPECLGTTMLWLGEIWISSSLALNGPTFAWALAHEIAHVITRLKQVRCTHADVNYLTLCLLWPRSLLITLDNVTEQTLVAAHKGPEWAASLRVHIFEG